ncbi:hypothetical protein CBS101457_001794 [Exobasidium rhododendri]|nr:hypothetical protein CBS101457_001794 [Exobasidium rhododendri]
MADPRYLEAWKRTPLSTPKVEPTSATITTRSAPSSTLQVRLDTPGGVTYSPNDMTSHNNIKRLFIAYKLGEGGDARDDFAGDEYNFSEDLKQEETILQEQEDNSGQISAARAYALSIDFDALAERRKATFKDQTLSNRVDEESEGDVENATHDFYDSNSISNQSRMSTSSRMSTATTTTLSSSKPDGSLPDWFTRTSANRNVVPFLVPPRLTKHKEDYQQPWDAMRWHGHRAFERPSERENEAGIAAFTDVNGFGRAPSVAETRQDDDSRSIMTTRTSKTARQAARSLNVADLFVVDPRKLRTLRMVRRTDPRQVLLLCNGVYLGASQVASVKMAQAAKKAGLDIKSITSNAQETQKMLSSLASSSGPRGGVGVIYCPHEEALSQDEDKLAQTDPRIDLNCAKRLEVPPTFTELTERRAQLRAVLTGLELANWEEEGFDKIVIGVEQNWIVRGISNDIWKWKHTGWKLTDQSSLGSPGESVPDRDLWELLDEAVSSYEKIDCNVRFWQVSPKDARLARNLAEVGALKDLQRPKLVRWRRKRPAILQASDARNKTTNHQGPTLSQVT